MTTFKQAIAPFLWVEHATGVSVIMNEVGDYQQFIFDSRADEGFTGNGYDWQSLAVVFLKETLPELVDVINFDSESGMFCAYSDNQTALNTFVVAFKKACENKALILALFQKAELD